MATLEKTKFFSSRDAQSKFGLLLDTARREPVRIQKHGRDVAVLISVEDYKDFIENEDQWWGRRAEASAKNGYLSEEESEAFLNEIIHAEDTNRS